MTAAFRFSPTQAEIAKALLGVKTPYKKAKGKKIDRVVGYSAEYTAAKFHASPYLYRGLMGPIGSGKSVACVTELLRLAHTQRPNKGGVRKTRFAIVRNTYPELKATTIKTWVDWVPEEFCPIKFDAPITGHMLQVLPDKTKIDMEVIFLALDKPKDVKKLLSLELTAVWINEAREVPKAIVDAAGGRIGRYPPKKDGGWSRKCVIMDTNPPDDDHWWYRLAEEGGLPSATEKDRALVAKTFQFFQQPPAIIQEGGDWVPNPAAENIDNLEDGYGYYLDQVAGKKLEWIKVYLQGLYGTVEEGKPVYPQYRDDLHCAVKPVPPHSPSGLILGWDFGLTPACVVCQITPRGQFRVLSELVALGMGITAFARDVVKPFLATKYPSHKVIGSFADPAGTGRAQTDERTCIDILNDADPSGQAISEPLKMGFVTMSAPSNDPTKRIEGVNQFLTKLIDGDPAFILSPDCKVLRKGFNGGYKYERVQVAGDERYKDQPAKNKFSHPHDALQYAALGATQSYAQAKAQASWDTSDFKRPVYN